MAITVGTGAVSNTVGADSTTSNAIDTTAATAILAAQAWYNAGITPTMGENQSDPGTWLHSSIFEHVAGLTKVRISILPGLTNKHASHLVTAAGVGAYCGIAVAPVAGIHLSAGVDQENSGQSAGSNLDLGAITPSEDNELVVIAIGSERELDPDLPSGYALIGEKAQSANNGYIWFAYLVQTTATTQDLTVTGSYGTAAQGVIASFKVAAAGGGGLSIPVAMTQVPTEVAMRFLKTNTATRVTVGPFLDKTDGITPETALTVTNCKLTAVVDDAGVPTLVLDTNPTGSGGANDMVHITGDDAGFYDLELAAANVNYVGRMMLALTDAANHCPVFHEFMIVPAMVYDSLVGGTDKLEVDAQQWLGQTIAAVDTNGYPKVTVKSGTGTGEISLSSGGVAVRGNVKKAAAFAKFMFLVTDSTNHNPATGKTVTATIAKDGGSFGSLNSGDSVTEVANGIYEVDLDATDTNANCLVLRFTAAGCDDCIERIITQL